MNQWHPDLSRRGNEQEVGAKGSGGQIFFEPEKGNRGGALRPDPEDQRRRERCRGNSGGKKYLRNGGGGTPRSVKGNKPEGKKIDRGV